MTEASVGWAPPGPGTWEFDSSHQSEPFGRYSDGLMLPASERGAARGFREAGLPLETLRSAVINGWWYVKLKPLGGSEESTSTPPAFVFWLLFNLHPELRRRRRSARRFIGERRWEALQKHWFEHDRARFVSQIRALQLRAPSALSDAELAEQLQRAGRVFEDLVELHFAAIPSNAIPTGDYLVHTEAWANVSAGQAIRAVAGFTEATTAPVGALDAMVEALRREERLSLLEDDDAARVVQRLSQGDQESARLYREYARDFGSRITTGYSVLGPTLNEMPGVILGSLRTRAKLDGASSPAREQAERVARELEGRIPNQHREAWLEMLRAARHCSGVRDDDCGLSLAVLGVARGLVLEAGKRLALAGRVDDAQSACDVTADELVEALRGAGPSKQEIARHTADRRRWARLTPPPFLGPPPVPPPLDSFPADVRRVVAAVFAFASRLSADGDRIPESGELCGHGISPGVVRGRACIVTGPSDFDRFQPGDVLVARATTPTFNTLIAHASAIVTQTGGLICHAAIVAREFGIPGVVGVQAALAGIPDGAWIEVDGDRGVIELLGQAPEASATADRRTPALELAPAPRPDTQPQIVDLEAVGDTATFGGKASTLGRLMRAGLSVPPGVVLDYAAAWSASRREASPLLSTGMAKLSPPFAVRSTANVEDASDASFAGQFVTRLGVRDGEALLEAIREVFDSAHSAGVMAYRQRLKLAEPILMSVLVQELVDAETAGVLFYDRARGRIVVEAAFGLGESVVSGEVTPDRFELDTNGDLLAEELGDKAQRLVMTGEGLERSPVPAADAAAPCLSRAQLNELVELGARVSEALGGPQDIEWAFDEHGRLYCLQARPVTRRI